MRAISTFLLVLGTATPAMPLAAQTQQTTRSSFDWSARGVSVDRFIYQGVGITAVSVRLSALRPNAVGSEIGVSLFPNALAAGSLIIAPDAGAAYNLKLAPATLLLKGGISAITGLAGSFGFFPGLHAGTGLIVPLENRAGLRLDVIRHFYQIDHETVAIWSIGIGVTSLPQKPMR